jgi:4-amino-4-deoxy-L-arabinose transferase-like glycosyltransferase
VRSIRRILLIVVLVALGLRLGWALSRSSDESTISQLPDQREYLESARSLLRGEGLSFLDSRFEQTVYAFRTPGYPLFLSACGAEPWIARLAQALLDTSTVLAVYLLARRWLSPGGSLFAALLIALNPFLIYFCGLLLTETLFTAMLAWGMVLLTHRSTLLWLLGGAILALSILVRPGAIGLAIVLGVLGAIANRGTERAYHRRWPLPVGTTMLLLTLAAVVPWGWRNHRVLGQWIWTSTNGGITVYDGFNPDASGASDQRFVKAMPQLRGMSEIGRDEYLSRQAQQYIRRYPFHAMQLGGAKALRTWSPRPLSSEFSRPVYVAAALVYAIPFDLLFLAGLLLAPLRRTVKLFLSAPAIYLTLVAMVSVGSLRYRVPAIVPMAVVAAGALEWFIRLSVVPADENNELRSHEEHEAVFE